MLTQICPPRQNWSLAEGQNRSPKLLSQISKRYKIEDCRMAWDLITATSHARYVASQHLYIYDDFPQTKQARGNSTWHFIKSGLILPSAAETSVSAEREVFSARALGLRPNHSCSHPPLGIGETDPHDDGHDSCTSAWARTNISPQLLPPSDVQIFHSEVSSLFPFSLSHRV